MSDDAGRPQRRPFEPPPWEREQFEELARRRAAEAAAEPEGPVREGVDAEAEGSATEDVQGEGTRVPAPAGPQIRAEQRSGMGLDERQAEAMMVQLSGEEGSALRPMRRAGLVTAAVLGAVGVVIVAVGLAFMVQSAGGAPAGVAGAAIVVVFGGGIIASAVWLWIRVERGQGVDVRG